MPLLVLSDAPTAGTGLSRITKDLTVRIAEHLSDVFEVATAGYGGPQSRHLPFRQYNLEMKDWVVLNLPEIWEDFAGERKGAIFFVWDLSRALWFAHPENCPDLPLRKFLQEATFSKWTYTPIDATGPHNRLTAVLKHTAEGFDRVLAYTSWSEAILRRTLWKKPLLETMTNLPHGLDSSVFFPRDKAKARSGFGERIGMRNQAGKWLYIPDNFFVIGIVATNQIRKDFGLGLQVVAELAKERPTLVWIHTDELERHWSLPALLNDFGLKNHAVTTVPLTDEQMAWSYSACDVTLGIGNGEGWGLPLSESLACGVPVIHGNYGGGTDFVPKEFLVEPIGYRLEGPYNCQRCVYSVQDWADKVRTAAGQRTECPAYIHWNNAWGAWEKWLREGAV